jgi:uncharacterized membrane protein YjdF
VQHKKNIRPVLVIGLMLIATALVEHLQGRLWKCECPDFIWTGNAWGSQTSQLFFDPYSFTHLLHGFMFAGLLTLLIRNMSKTWRFVMAIAIECAWEMIENSNTIIDRYRQATAALGYHGDSVLNSMGDVFCCGVGFLLAVRLGWRWGIVMFVGVELALTLCIRDSLLLEMLMLIHPFDSIKTWQLGH